VCAVIQGAFILHMWACPWVSSFLLWGNSVVDIIMCITIKDLFFAQLFLYNQELVLLKFICLEAFTVTEFNKIFLGSHLKALKILQCFRDWSILEMLKNIHPWYNCQPEKILLKALEVYWVQVNGATMNVVL